MRRVAYSREAIKALNGMPANVAATIRSKIEQYAIEPASLARNVVKLQGRPGYRLRVGDWRVIFSQSNTVMEIGDIRPRGSAYD